VLWLYLHRSRLLSIGRLGDVRLVPGFYGYVGSAFGPGGVRARLGRHLRGSARAHWHIDYLRTVCRAQGAWMSYDGRRLEHIWAQALLALPGARLAVPGFGATDCGCETHLVGFSRAPSLAALRRRLGVSAPSLRRIRPVLS
jgi:Uri superfamily endonuclease